MEASRFSRCVTGRFEFAPHEKTRIAEVLGFPSEWLFAEVKPPRPGMKEAERILTHA